ncbi:MAG: hypothetical protein RLZZ15_3805, partial [Verrucomicrobiota bacterium]
MPLLTSRVLWRPVVTLLAFSVAPLFAADAPANARHELTLLKWSGAVNVPDPVACAVDPQGRVYVTTTTRRKVGDLDIREHPMWIPDDVGLASVEEKAAFLRRELAPGKLRAPRGGLADHNADGSIDWKDLTFHSEVIYQLRDTDGDGVADKMTVFADGFNTEVTGIAAGVMYHDGWVYATIAPDLWRFKDTNDDGVADIREKVVSGFGVHLAYAGHDMHGLSVGPDGKIYWSIGDKGAHVVSREGRTFSFPNEGCIMRVNPDGSDFEIYARGTRNVQEPAFNEVGDLIGVDNDADQPGERERFVFLPETSDTGWRCNFQYMKTDSPWMREGLWKPAFAGQAAYLLPPILSYSDGPAGFRFEPGTALSDGQRGMFILNEFPSGKMKGFRAVPDGASYKMADARILNEGIMGIGLSWHPDGSLMMADWIGGYPLDGLGALWRVDAKGADDKARKDTAMILGAGFEKRADAELVAQLSHGDLRVRQGAQLELAKRGRAEAFLAAAMNEKGNVTSLGRLHALWGYGQLLRRSAADAAAVLPLLRDTDPEVRRQVAKIFGDAAATGAKGQGRALVPLLTDVSPRVRLLAAIALGKFREPTAVEPLLAMAERDGGDGALRQGVVAGLEGCAPVARFAATKAHASVALRLVSVVALRRLAAPEVAAFLDDADALVAAEAARAIHDDLSIPAALPALAAVLPRAGQNEVIARRAINAGLRLGTPEAAARLVVFALDGASPRALRAEALNALKVWNTPPRLDLVDGRARKFSPQPIASVLAPQLDALLALTDPGLKTLGIEIMVAHALKAGVAQIAAIVADGAASGTLRAQALRLMDGEGRASVEYGRALEAALDAKSPAPLHRAALEMLTGERLATEVRAVLASRSVPEKQHAIARLALAGAPATDAVLAELADQLVAGTCAAELRLDVAEALGARGAARPALAAKLKTFLETPAAKARGELLAGGDVARGRDLVANHLAANCTACHAVEVAGSEVGPSLR